MTAPTKPSPGGPSGPVPQAALDQVWQEPVQRARALDGLVADGLVEPLADGLYRLPLS